MGTAAALLVQLAAGARNRAAPHRRRWHRAGFLLEVFDDDLLVVVHPAGEAAQEKGQGIHDAIFSSADPGDEHFVGDRPLRLGRKHSNSMPVSFVQVFGQYAAGIVAFIPDESLMQTIGFNLNTFGYVRVQVTPEDYDTAKTVLSEHGPES